MSAIHWFEIPVANIERAKKYYDAVLPADIQVMDLIESQGSKLGMLHGGDGVSGAIVENSQHGYIPSKEGSLVYLVVNSIDASLAQVEGSGGKILLPKTSLGEMDPGFTAWIEDTEGNCVGLYST